MSTILVDSKPSKSSKSLSPVIKKSALESLERESKKLSFSSLQTEILLVTSTNSAYS